MPSESQIGQRHDFCFAHVINKGKTAELASSKIILISQVVFLKI